MSKAEITQAQIDAWKAEHENVYKLQVEDKVCYLKSPDRKTLGYAGTVGTKDPLKFNEIILKACWLAGDMELQTNDTLFMSVGQKLGEIINIKEATLEKL